MKILEDAKSFSLFSSMFNHGLMTVAIVLVILLITPRIAILYEPLIGSTSLQFDVVWGVIKYCLCSPFVPVLGGIMLLCFDLIMWLFIERQFGVYAALGWSWCISVIMITGLVSMLYIITPLCQYE